MNKKRNNIVIEGVCTIRHITKNDKWELDAGLKLAVTVGSGEVDGCFHFPEETKPPTPRQAD